MRLALASDHAGYRLKQELAAELRRQGHAVEDLGPESEAAVDYPDYARRVGERVRAGAAERGVLVCGSGIGMAMAANRLSGVRAANIYSEESARLSREHNDANVITLGARLLTAAAAVAALEVWLATPFLGGRHAARVAKIET